MDWLGVFDEEGEEKSIGHDSVTKGTPSSSSSSLSESSSAQQRRLHPVVTATAGGLVMNGAGYDNLFLQCEGIDLTIPSKRRIRRVSNVPFPKIMKSDIRHKLSLMFTNAMNSADGDLVKNFYRTFCVGSCQFIDKVGEDMSTGIFRGVKPFCVDGLDNLIRRVELCRDFTPDSAILLKHSYINRQIDQPGSRVVMEITAHATVVKHGVVAVQGVDQKRHLVPSFMVEEFVRAGTVDIDQMSLEKHPPDAQPISLDISGATVLWLDNNNRIYCIESLGKVESPYRN